MNLLIITQKVDKDDPILGFFHRWIEEFALSGRCDKVSVICLQEGHHVLPDNVQVWSLGKESGRSKIKYLINFYKYIIVRRREYDSVFVHMNQIYVILGGLFWRLMRKKVGLWYAHGATSTSLKIASCFANNIFTSTESGFKLKSKKKNVVGQGIDTDLFNSNPSITRDKTILTVGRISKVKRNLEMLKIIKDSAFDLHIIGSTVTDLDEKYKNDLDLEIKNLNMQSRVKFIGNIQQSQLPEYYNRASIFLNLSQTASLDKTILEAMACETLVLTTNESADRILRGINYPFVVSDLSEVSTKIKEIEQLSLQQKQEIGKSLRAEVDKNHKISRLIKNVLAFY